jgi:pyruvate dehydrogenase E1 component
MDEPESAGALHMASKERLDNLIFVVCCNLQRLDGPVRGSGKIVQELEQLYRGAGWNVIKVVWNRKWDKLLARDSQGILVEKLQLLKDGDLQRFKAMGAQYLREHFFNQNDYLKSLVADFSDDDLAELEYGGHDFQKVYAAYDQAVSMNNGRPTVVLAQTVKGYGMGEAGESQNISHQQKKMDVQALKAFCQRFNIPLSEPQIEQLTYYKPEDDSELMRYLNDRRRQLGGYVPSRPQRSAKLVVPELKAFNKVLEGSGDREISTTMAFVRIISVLLRDKNLKDRIVPIIPDEARTFGMEGLFRQIGIYAVEGQLFESHDQKQIMAYREAKDGQLLEEGLTEAGSMCSWIAAGTSHNNNDLALIPFYIYYAMFGYQRTGDLMWAAGDMRARGFLMGGTAGRTTLAGEGLQHQDGHNPVCFCLLPTCRVYDPTFSYELAVIIQHGIKEMYHDDQDVFYYLTLMNENYYHPPMPEGVETGIIKGLYHYQKAAANAKIKIQLMGSGTILNEVIKAAELLKNDFNVHADIWSVTSFGELRKDGLAVERQHRLGNAKDTDKPYVTQVLANQKGPVVAATDYVRLYADLIRQFVPLPYYVLGTDGFGRSDSRDQLRSYFEVDANWIAYTAIVALVEQNEMDHQQVAKAAKQYRIDSAKSEPWHH